MAAEDFLVYQDKLRDLRSEGGLETTRTWLKVGVLVTYRIPPSREIRLAAELDDRDGFVKLVRGENLRQTIKDNYGINLK